MRITFATGPLASTPTPDERRWHVKIEETIRLHRPFIVAEGDERVIGYSYAAKFRDRSRLRRNLRGQRLRRIGAAGTGVWTALMTP